MQVLIVDDQAAFRRAGRPGACATTRFRSWSARPHTGEASVEAVRALRPDLVLMDIHLPGYQRARGDAAHPGRSGRRRPPVVFLLSTYEAADYADQTIGVRRGGLPGQG